MPKVFVCVFFLFIFVLSFSAKKIEMKKYGFGFVTQRGLPRYTVDRLYNSDATTVTLYFGWKLIIYGNRSHTC